MNRKKNGRLVSLQRQQVHLLEVEKELRKMITNVNESLNALKVEELQLKSYAISCVVGLDNHKDNYPHKVPSQQPMEKGDVKSSVSCISTTSSGNLTSEWLTARTSLVSSTHSWHDAFTNTSVEDINKQEINLDTNFSSALHSNDVESEEEDDDDDDVDVNEEHEEEDEEDEEDEDEETSDDDQPYEM